MRAAGFSAQHISFFPSTTQKQLRTAEPTSAGSSRLKKKQRNWCHSFTLPQFPVSVIAQVPGSRCCPSSSPGPVPSAVVDGAACTGRDILLDDMEQMDWGGFDCFRTLLVYFLFVLVSCWLFRGREVCLINCLKPWQRQMWLTLNPFPSLSPFLEGHTIKLFIMRVFLVKWIPLFQGISIKSLWMYY